MSPGKKRSSPLRERIQALLNAERSPMCWEIGYFQAPMLVREPGKPPSKPYMLVCIDTESGFVLGSDLVLDHPTPQDFLSLIVHSMETRGVEGGAPIRPETVRLGDPDGFELLGRELGQLDVKLELVGRLAALEEFKKIAEHEFFSRQPGFSGHTD